MWDVEPFTLDLSDVISISDDDLMKISSANPDLRIERNAAGQLEILSPSGLSSSACGGKILGALAAWNERQGDGIIIPASGGFRLPNGAVRAADVAWVRRSDWDALAPNVRDGFAPLVPVFVVEVRSPSDRLRALQAKMAEWIQNGCRLAWMVDPIGGNASVYRADGSSEQHPLDATLSGEEVLPGFQFDLSTLP